MKRIYTILLVTGLLILTTFTAAGQTPLTGTGTLSFNQIATSTSYAWIIDVKEAKKVRITYATEFSLSGDQICFLDVKPDGSYVVPPTTYLTGYVSGTYITTTTTGKILVAFSTTTTGTNKKFTLNYAADNSINTANDLYVGGNGGIIGKLGVGTYNPKAKLESVTGVNAFPATSGTTQSGAALRLRGGDNAVLDFGLNSTSTWIQASDQTALGTNYNIILNPNGGNVGIGTTAPGAKLEINDGQIYINNGDAVYCSKDKLGYQHHLIGTYQGWDRNSIYIAGYNNTNNSSFATKYITFGGPGGGGERMKVDLTNGNIRIGTSATNPTTELLTVFGIIHAKEVQVDLTGSLADFVFHPSYKLMPLHLVEQYVKTNSHLPEIPSAAEITKNGMSIGDMQNKLLQKIEELTLYMIEQQKQIEDLKLQLKK